MCMVSKEKANYCVVVTDLEDNAICEIDFESITLLCRYLEMFNFAFGKCVVIRNKDHIILDHEMLLEIWRNEDAI